ncbi:SDR family NAD(P)-dependent oxidoreductase [Erythrobacter litoralis]|uniref:SDR family oxidoreductase n=1 Tax=Erythrobacter litoralis TaxID=39960 RepID=UPI0024360063|nr:SDR family oxidoreductase [Erythrobacter litoralis]MDG6078087.1 SDR family NAD(P)-dependent oxidoreductase [Erythrobacter litoralis]
MTRVLVLGGYGGFGGRISRRLVRAGHEVIVAGRSLAKAEAFCAGKAGLMPARMGRDDISEGLSKWRPAIVVDASGPFQEMDLAVPRAAIAAGVHYCDIADSTAFVTAIAALDAEAKAAGVAVFSGASSVPALSGAIVRDLAEGLDTVSQVCIAISASNRATAGGSVAAAIIGQVGQPFRLWRGKQWTGVHGWQEPRRQDFSIAGRKPLNRRLVALVDVPDVALLPSRLPGGPTVEFRAGGELAFQNAILWLLSWPVRWGWIASLAPLARWLLPFQRLTAWLGSDRSAMMVKLFGMAGSKRIERCWTLIAEDGDGPEIPTLAVVPLVAKMRAGEMPIGAHDAGDALTLDDYAAAFAKLSTAQARTERILPPPLYACVMGDRFHRLPPSVRAMHSTFRDGGATGKAQVTGAANPLGGLIARIVGFPRAGHYPLHVTFAEDATGERWTRKFGQDSFRSFLGMHNGILSERFGPLRFLFDLPTNINGLTMEMKGWSAFGIPLPLVLAPRSLASEWEEKGRFYFDVPISLPLIGRLVHYRGWLEQKMR